MSRQTNTRPLAIGLTVVAALARLAPHPWNFTPVGSLSLFAGARLRGWLAFVLPLVLMAVTDPLLGGYSRGHAAGLPGVPHKRMDRPSSTA